MTLRTIP